MQGGRGSSLLGSIRFPKLLTGYCAGGRFDWPALISSRKAVPHAALDSPRRSPSSATRRNPKPAMGTP